jgi:uncharacterized protein (TIGR03067 family)
MALLAIVSSILQAPAQEKSVRPGINQPFENPDVKEFIGKFEGESREVFTQRKQIVAACGIKAGMAVADIGAGTGLFTRLFAQQVGPQGQVYAVDIAPKFIEHTGKTCREAGIKNVVGVVCTADSVKLPPNSIDLAFICDTYHHFEFPSRTMASIHEALRPGGRLVLIDFHRIEGKSSEWVLNHVRVGQEIVTREIVSSGFKKVGEEQILKENYFVRFEKVQPAQAKNDAGNDLEKFQGAWTLISVQRDGTEMPQDEVQKIKLTIQGDEFVLEKAGALVSRGTFRLDPTKQPKEIDETLAMGPNKGKVFLAIYEIDDRQHRICFAAYGKDRPQTFSSVAGSGNLFQVWRREKK